MKTLKKYLTVSGILIIILLIAGAAAYKNFLDLAEVNRLETNKRITLKKIEIVLGKVTDAETGQRGYIITGNEDYLRPYYTAIATIDKDIKELRFMTKDNAGHQQMLDTLEPLIIEKLGGLANRINLRKNKGFAAAAREVRIGKGKDVMDKIRKTTNGMEEDIRKSMEQKRKEIESQSKHTAFFILFGSSLAILIVGIASFITRREFIVRKQAEEELKKHHDDLEELVVKRTAELTKTNKQLEMEISEHKKTEENLNERELRYESLFKNSPISLWEEDFSDVKKYIDSLRSRGIRDFRTYFQDHPEDVVNCATMVKVVDVNEVTLKMYHAGSVEDLKGLDSVFAEESYEVFKEELIALAEGKFKYASEAVNRTLGGRKIHTFIMWIVPPGYEVTWSKALVSIIDITDKKQVEIALVESEKKYRNLVENTLVGIYTTDIKGNVLYVNKALLKMLEFESSEDIMAESALMRYKNPTDREILIEELKRINTISGLELELITKKGNIKHVILSAYFDNGNETISGMIMDITERKIAEENLRLYQNKIETLINSSRDIIFLKDEKCRYLIANKANESFFNIKMEDIIYKTDFDFMPKELAEICRKSDEMALISKTAVESEEYFGDKCFHVVKQNVIDEKGNIVGIAAVIRDITERKQAEEQLKAASNEWRSTFDSAHDIIMLLDNEMKIIKANLAAAKFLKKSITEIIGEKYSKFFLGRDSSLTACPFKKMKKTGKHEEKEFYLSERDAWLSISADPVVDDHGNLTRGVIIIKDVTENKHSRDQLRALNEQLRDLAGHLQTLREEERIVISHDIHDELGQKLSGLKFELMYLQNLLSGNEERDRSLFEKVRSISQLIDSLIQWSRDLMTSLRPSILDDMGIEATLEWLVKEFQRRLQIPCILNVLLKNFRPGDALAIAIFRICQECLTNISRYAHATSVTINLQKIDDNIILEVIDNGIGITEDQIKNSKSYGLIGMRERAIMLGGEFIIMGEEGKGTTVTVTIPKSSMDMK